MRTPARRPVRSASRRLACGLALAAAASLAACNGGASHVTPVAPPAASGGAVPAALVAATVTVRVPTGAAASASVRRLQYVSTATQSIGLHLGAPPAGYVQPAVVNVTAGPAPCPFDPVHDGYLICTVPASLPPGADAVTLTTYDAANATGNVLSQQVQTLTVAVGAPNTFALTLDAKPATAIASDVGPCSNGPVGGVASSVGTNPVTFVVSGLDAAGKTLAAPGLPTISIAGSTTSGVLTGTNGGAAFSINQSARTFTLTPVGPTATANVPLSLLPANSTGQSDGLPAAGAAKTFTFEVGPGPQATHYLAVVDKSVPPVIDLDVVALAVAPAPDTIVASTPATLASTTSTTQTGVADVDHPTGLVFDSGGDLLIANGGGTPTGDVGNLACVPASAITTGEVASTTTTALVDGPLGIAYDARDGSVALADAPATATDSLSEYLLQGPYAPAPPARQVARSGSLGAPAVAALPALAAGSYAVALTTGNPKPPHGSGTSEIEIVPNGIAPYTFTDATIDDPTGLAYDAMNNQLAIASASVYESTLDFYSVTRVSATLVKSIAVSTPTSTTSSLQPSLVATSADGHVAVAGATFSGEPQVQVYGNTGARAAVGGPIPFNGTVTQNGADYLYDQNGGGTAVVNALTWLSNTKLLVSFGTGLTNKQGLYIADIAAAETVPAGYDDFFGTPFAAAPPYTLVKQMAHAPGAAAYRP